MSRVTIKGWREGFNKVQFNHLLRQYGALGLKDAKHAVDRVLAGDQLTLDLSGHDSATAFCVSARAVGVECSEPVEVFEESFALPKAK